MSNEQDNRPIDQVEQALSSGGVTNVPQISSREFKPRSIVIVTLRAEHKMGHPEIGTPVGEFFADGVKTVDAIFECVGPGAHQCSVLVPNPEDPTGKRWRMHVEFDDIKLKPKKIVKKQDGGVKPLEIPNGAVQP